MAATAVLGVLVGGLLALILVPLWGGVGSFVVLAVGLVYVGFWSLRVVLAGVHVSAEGIRIVDPLLARRLRWDQIRSFEFGRFGPFLPRVAWVELISGERVRIWAIQGSLLSSTNATSRRLVAELNRTLEVRRRIRLT